MKRQGRVQAATAFGVLLLSLGLWFGFRSPGGADPDLVVRVERGTVQRSVVGWQ